MKQAKSWESWDEGDDVILQALRLLHDVAACRESEPSGEDYARVLAEKAIAALDAERRSRRT